MITFIRTVTVQPGKMGETITWQKELNATIKRVIGREMTLCASFGGVVSALAWIGQFDSVGQLEDATNKLMANADYMTGINKAGGLVVPASGHDQIWRHLP
ncbi:MAG TPA: hypothetical protein VK430_04065 [Xanthobacteraceae bacterium]|nr:hypothetical protein [Xanthobacteraceae bacterium]